MTMRVKYCKPKMKDEMLFGLQIKGFVDRRKNPIPFTHPPFHAVGESLVKPLSHTQLLSVEILG